VESARLESGQMELRREPINLYGWLLDTLPRLGDPEERRRVELEAPEHTPQVLADPERLERVVVNLVSNALRYSPADTPVTVRVGELAGEAIVAVSDLGVGIEETHQAHLFDRYYRVEGSKKSEGLGLGLYISRLIVEAHGGRIWVESRPGQGSTFSFSLSLA
jgi:two-component system, NtrC family, sensor histidine kinase KinB